MIPIGCDVRLSVIVPVYQAEKHLNNCVDSILNNASDGYEIILVDDGSTDAGPAICDDYKTKYDHIRVIHQDNGGLALARNAGLDAAQGTFVTFIDADDIVDKGFVDRIIASSENGDDILVFPMKIDYTQTEYTRIQEIPELSTVSAAEAAKALEIAGAFNMSCSKAYRREMLEQSPQTRFTPHTEPGEDLIYNCDCFVKAQTVTLVNDAYYHWIRRGEDTLANRFRKDLYEKNKMFIDHRNRLYRELGLDQTEFALLSKGNLAYIFACVPNMYRGKNTFPRRERIGFYNEILQSEDVKKWIAATEISSSLMKQFVRMYKTKSAFLMDSYYSAVTWGRRRFDKVWQIIRRRMK